MALPLKKRMRRTRTRQTTRRSLGQRLHTELLEDRLVMASDSVFAEFLGRIDEFNPVERIPVVIAPEQVGLKSGALIGFHLESRDGVPFDPALIQVRNGAGQLVAPFFQNADLPGGLGSVAIVGLAAGDYTIEVGGDRGTVGRYELNVFLAGDFDGNHQIDRADVTEYRAHYGARAGDARYDLTADVNLDGLISAQDFSLWQRNNALNLPTTVAPAYRLASPERTAVSNGTLIRPQLLSSFVATAAGPSAAASGTTPTGTVYDGVTAVLPTTGYNPAASTQFIEGRIAWGQAGNVAVKRLGREPDHERQFRVGGGQSPRWLGCF